MAPRPATYALDAGQPFDQALPARRRRTGCTDLRILLSPIAGTIFAAPGCSDRRGMCAARRSPPLDDGLRARIAARDDAHASLAAVRAAEDTLAAELYVGETVEVL